MVFTSRDIDEMVRSGGSQAWKLGHVTDARRARRCVYLVTAWHAHGPHTNNPAYREHREGVLLARITGIEPADTEVEGPNRYIILFDRYEPISVKNAWPQRRRKEFRYGTLEQFGL